MVESATYKDRIEMALPLRRCNSLITGEGRGMVSFNQHQLSNYLQARISVAEVLLEIHIFKIDPHQKHAFRSSVSHPVAVFPSETLEGL